MTGKRIDEKIKKNVIKAYEKGVPQKKIAERFSISPSSVSRIVKKKVSKYHHENKVQSDVKMERQKRIEDLERRILELEKKIIEYEAKRKVR